MLNPLVKNRQYFTGYLIVWLFVALVQVVFFHFLLEVGFWVSVADAVVFNLIFALMGISLWYVIRVKIREDLPFTDLFLNHLITGVATVALWIGGAYSLMLLLDPRDAWYMKFLNQSLPWRAISGIFFYLIFVLIYYILIYNDDLQQKLKTEAELNNLIREAELDALKAQINPHFLFNSLNSISSLTITDPGKAQEMVIRLSDFMRYSLSYDRNETTTLRLELENAQRYLEIEKVRFGKRLKYHFNTDVGCDTLLLPNMILQPLLENAVKHGVHQSVGEVMIQLNCADGADFATLKITNNYDPDAKRIKGEGVGLNNIRKRLQLTYQRADLFEVKPDENQFEVLIRIPKHP